MWAPPKPVTKTPSSRPPRSSPTKSQGSAIPKYHNLPSSRHSFLRRDYELPPELLLETFYHLQEDVPSLHTCSTVCRAWLPCARYYFIPTTFNISTRNAATLFALFASRCCTLGQYFNHLTLDTRQATPTYEHLFNEMKNLDGKRMSTFLLRPTFDISACVSCLTPRVRKVLQSLIVRDVGPMGRTDFRELTRHIKRFQVLTRLELIRCRVSSLSELFAVLEARPTLRSVSFVDIACVNEGDSNEEASLHVLAPLPMTDLTLQTSLQTAILQRLMTHYSRVPFLSSLSLGGIGQSTADRQVTDTFLRMLGGSLRTLKIYLNKWIGVTLAHNYNLQSLTIRRYPFSISNPFFYSSIPGLISLLSQLPPDARLIHLSIQFLVADDALPHLPWKAVGDSLRDRRFAKLRRLRVQCLGHGENIQESVTDAFPAYFKRKGILKVRSDFEDPPSDES